MIDQENVHGVVHHAASARKTDFLYRISLKGFIQNDKGEVLVVKETGRESKWDLPGGGMDHEETIRSALAREMYEEVSLEGDFEYSILEAEEPRFIQGHSWWQLRLIFAITPANMKFSPGEDGDEIAFIDPRLFKDSESFSERQVYEYAKIVERRNKQNSPR
ncbi:MAG TPA: NUDIX hydrolase [Candidatus Saccharimonadales bacterium]|nr:NUDIX hydrolase [Candidatus Saccharimonadales bacterium]